MAYTNFELSRGAIKAIYSETPAEGSIVQICSIKTIQSNQPNGGSNTRFRLTISDGDYYIPAMLATQLNDMVTNQEIERYSIIRLTKYLCNSVHDRKIAIVLKMEVLQKEVGQTIGAPIAVDTQGADQPPPPQQNQQQRPPPANSYSAPSSYGQPSAPAQSGYQGGNRGGQYGGAGGYGNPSPSASPARNATPIAAINPYQNRWVIRARVMSKGTLRHYSNQRGEGRLISIDLCDASGEIRATAFNEMADKINELIEPNRVYKFEKGTVKMANQKYSSLKHQYEITFDRNTTIEEVNDDDAAAIPTVKFDFMRIADIENKAADTIVDVLGVVKDVHDVMPITTKAGKALVKRDVTIMDDSNVEISMTLWGTQAENFADAPGTIVAVKGCRVGDYQGKNLSMLASSVLMTNPDDQEAHRLRGWYESIGRTAEVQSLSRQGNMGVSMANSWNDPHMSLGELEKPEVKDSIRGKSLYFITKGFITMIKKDNAVYMACSGEQCNKKLVDAGHGQWRCERCNQEIAVPSKRMLLSMKISDDDGQHWVTAFNEQAEQLLGMSAEQLWNLQNSNSDAYDAIFANTSYQHYEFKIRARLENYNDMESSRCHLQAFRPIDYKRDNEYLLAEIHKLKMQGA